MRMAPMGLAAALFAATLAVIPAGCCRDDTCGGEAVLEPGTAPSCRFFGLVIVRPDDDETTWRAECDGAPIRDTKTGAAEVTGEGTVTVCRDDPATYEIHVDGSASMWLEGEQNRGDVLWLDCEDEPEDVSHPSCRLSDEACPGATGLAIELPAGGGSLTLKVSGGDPGDECREQ